MRDARDSVVRDSQFNEERVVESASATARTSLSKHKSSNPQMSSVHHVDQPRGGRAAMGEPLSYARMSANDESESSIV